MNGIKENNFRVNFILFLIVSLYVLGFILNEDSSGSGKFDYFNYIIVTQENLSKDFLNVFLNQKFSGYTPLHFLIYYPISNIFGIEYLRVINFILSFVVIFIFYNLLKKNFPEIKNSHLIFIALLPTLDPYFRSSAYWFQNEITGLIFLLISFNLFINYEVNKKIKNIFFIFIFCGLAFYSKQNYIIFTIFYFFYFLLNNKNYKFFINFTILNLIIYTPYFYVLYKFNNFAPNAAAEVFSVSLNNILIFFSILSFYFIPFFIFKINKNFLNENKYLIILSCFVVLILAFFFDYNNKLGGGAFYKISNLILGNNIIFFLSSFAGLFFFLNLVKSRNLRNMIIFLPILLIFIFLKVPFQEYVAIYFFYIYFLILKKNFINNIFNNFNFKLIFIYSYFLFFLIGSIFYNFLNLKSLINL